MSDAIWPPFTYLACAACVTLFYAIRKAGASAAQTAAVLSLVHSLAEVSWAFVGVMQKNGEYGVSTPVQISLMAGSVGYHLYSLFVSLVLVRNLSAVLQDVVCLVGLGSSLLSGVCGKFVCMNMVVFRICTPLYHLLKSGLLPRNSARYRQVRIVLIFLLAVTRLLLGPFLAQNSFVNDAPLLTKASSAVLTFLGSFWVTRELVSLTK